MKNFLPLSTSFSNDITLFCLAIVVLSFGIVNTKVFAIDEQFYSSNDILFYNPDDVCASSTSSNSSTSASASVGLEKSATLQQIFQLLLNGGLNAGQAAAVMGNMYAESGFNSDAHENGNDIGYGLVQWSFERRTSLERFASDKGVAASDIPTQIEFLFDEYNSTYKSRLAGTPFEKGTDIAASAEAWMMKFEAPALDPPNDPAALNSKRIPAAQTIYGYYSGLSPSSVVASDGCNTTGNSAVAGDMVQTALNYALEKPASSGMTAKTDARNTYQVAKEQYNPTVDWTDCGGFIATVMIASGVDPNYPLVSVSTQLDYVKSHPEKYTILEHPSVGDLQPGDILLSISAGHTTMYTGQQQYPDVDASLGDRVPSVRDSGNHIWMLANGAVIARVIK